MSINDKSLKVRQSNSLIDASYRIASVGEGRLIRALIAQISPNDEDFRLYRVSVEDFARLFNITGESAYEQIKKAADELTSRKIRIEEGKNWLFMNWLSSAEYKNGSGYVELCFDKKLKPYLLQLKGYFTQYELENVVSFKSAYSIRIYELLKAEQFKAGRSEQFSKTFSYEELRSILGIADNEYSQFAFFRVNVVEVASREINANGDIKVEAEYLKAGRKVSHVVFRCEKAKGKKPPSLEPPQNADGKTDRKEHPEYIAELTAIGIDEEVAYMWKRKYSVARLREAIAYTKAMQEAGKIRTSLTGFLFHAVTKNTGASWAIAQAKALEKSKKTEDAEKKKKNEDEATIRRQRENRAKALEMFESLSQTEQEEVKAEYLKNISELNRNSFEKKGTKDILFQINLARHFNINSERKEEEMKY